MPGETFYFSHDYSTRSDDKIKQLIRRHGMTGYGVFWAIIEDLYQNANALRSDCDGIAYDLRVHSDMVKSILFDFDLFVHEGDKFGSVSVQRRIDERNERSVNARKSASYRWNNANAMRTHSDRNAIKESKGKESKVIDSTTVNKGERKKQVFAPPDPWEVVDYAKEIASGSEGAPQDFYDYYQSNGWKVGNKGAMKDWRAAFRRWAKNEKTMNHDTNQSSPSRGISSRTRADFDALEQWQADVIRKRDEIFGGPGRSQAT